MLYVFADSWGPGVVDEGDEVLVDWYKDLGGGRSGDRRLDWMGVRRVYEGGGLEVDGPGGRTYRIAKSGLVEIPASARKYPTGTKQGNQASLKAVRKPDGRVHAAEGASGRVNYDRATGDVPDELDFG